MKRKIDLMTILGLTLAVALMFVGIILSKDINTGEYSIGFVNLKNFWDPTSVAIVIGGTFGALMIMFPASQFTKIGKHMSILFMPKQYDPKKYIDKLIELAKKARINGLLSLEEDAAEIDDAFMKNSIQMIVDSLDPEKVKIQMESWLDDMDERHYQERTFYDNGAALGPAFGMIGTLIGLINMMKSLSDVESVGPNMAVALITTFYGSLLANLIFSPISNKLRVRHDEEFLCKRIISEGVQAIQSGENPNLIRDRLMNMLPEYKKKRYSAKDKRAGAEGEGAEAEGGGKPEKGGKK